MWQEDQKEYMRANFAFLEREFAFLKDYGFSDIEFLFLEEDAQKGISFDAVVAIIRNAQELFVIKKLRAYYFEPLQFYLLQAGEPLSEIFTYRSEKEIDVYCRDSDLWEQAERSKKSFSDQDIIEVVAQSIKRQLKNGATQLYDSKVSPRSNDSARKKLMIKSNQSFYKNVLIAFNGLIILMGSLCYFLGFTIDASSLLFYGVFLISTIISFFIVFLIIDKCNKKYIVFDGEKIKEESKYGEKVIVYYHQILYTRYHNRIDLFHGIIDFGFVEIVYKTDSKDKEPKYCCLYLSKKNYRKIFHK